jgi:hypothetical protein
MDTDLTPVKAALADLTGTELHALIAASNGAPPIAYGLLVWIEGACDWELNRRVGHDYDRKRPGNTSCQDVRDQFGSAGAVQLCGSNSPMRLAG